MSKEGMKEARKQLSELRERLNESHREFEKACDEHIERHGINAKVYLSGRISGLHPDVWRMFFINKEIFLRIKHPNIKVVNPADTIIARNLWFYKIVGYRFTLWYDLRMLKRCTHICMVGDDWHISRGARLERIKARKWNIKVLER